MTVREAVSCIQVQLHAAGLDEPLREAQLLVAACLGWTRAYLIAHADVLLSAQQAQRLHCWARRRAQREPLAYLTRRAWFYGLPLVVGRGALIPRPETELLVEVFLEWAQGKAHFLSHDKGKTVQHEIAERCTLFPSTGAEEQAHRVALTPSSRAGGGSEAHNCPQADRPILVDAGTGTGAVALACLRHAPNWLGIGIDCSRRALQLAHRNRRALGLESRLLLLQGNWLCGLRAQSVDAVLSNPPYVLPDEWDWLAPEITRYEPKSALLVPADDPLRPYRQIAQAARLVMRIGGLLAFETSPRLAPLVAAQLPVWGFPEPQVVCDYSGAMRVVRATRA
jgi:release factor glutamine methyltransferase